MKTLKLLTFLLTLLVVSSVYAQKSNDEIQVLVTKKNRDGKVKFDNGFYAGMSFGWTMIDGKSSFIIGPRVAWIANHYFALGAGGGMFSNFMSMPRNDDYYPLDEYFMMGGYGGILLEPIVLAKHPVHVSFPVIIGGGFVAAQSKNGWNDYSYNGDYYNNDVFFVFEPGAELELNIAKFFRIALGGSYRLTNALDMQYKYFDEKTGEFTTIDIDKHALNAFNVKLSLKFGIF